VPLDDRDEQALARPEVVVERGRVALPGERVDLADRHGVDPVPGEQVLRGVEQPLSGRGSVASHRCGQSNRVD
jgi:hypothetical protein